MTVPSKEAQVVLPWVHTFIGNLKRVLNGIYHRASDKYLQFIWMNSAIKPIVDTCLVRFLAGPQLPDQLLLVILRTSIFCFSDTSYCCQTNLNIAVLFKNIAK